jgi:hypothetical protein
MRKYSKCIWCGRTIDITNSDRELCNPCSTYSNLDEMAKFNLWYYAFNKNIPSDRSISKNIVKEFLRTNGHEESKLEQTAFYKL